MNEETVFPHALSLPSKERAAFLDQACDGRPDLRTAVEALLAAHEKSGNVLDSPAVHTVDSGTDQPYLGAAFDQNPGPDNASSSVTETTEFVTKSASGHVTAGRFTLQEKIGEGGMGEVWVAKQTEPVKRKVALKLIKTGMDSRAVLQRFEQERQALAMMDHPNIAKVLDGGLTPASQPFFVMELVNGLALSKFCDEARLNPRERLELFVPICQAVQHATQKGIVHRDLKPANILVTMIDGKPVPKVIDFGVAKAIAGKLTDESMSTQFGAVIGTFEYMSPEQAGFSGIDIDTRADIYSLGVMLYELLTGLRPFDARRLREAALTEMIRIIREEEPSKPSTRLSTAESLPSMAALRQTEPRKLMALLRGELDWVVMKCLEKHRERRYETANALARDIQRYLADEPVEARPPSAGYRFSKFLLRNRGPVLAASLVLLALVFGIVGTTVGMIQADRRRVEAVEARGREAERAEGERLAREQEAAQRAKAEKARDRTRQALDAMTSSVTGDSLATQKGISDEQKRFLTEVLTYYKEFAGEKADDEPSRARTAEAAHRVGLIEYRLGRTTEAAEAYRTAINGFARLVDEFPAVPVYRNKLAGSYVNMGLTATILGKRPEADEQYRNALPILEKLATDFPAMPLYRDFLANNHNNLGILLRDAGRLSGAEEQFRKAHAIREKLVGEFPTGPEYRKDLALSQLNLGVVLRDLGQRKEAEEHFRKALAMLEKLAAEFPTVPDHRHGLHLCHNNLGILLKDLAKAPEGEQQHRKALAIEEKLVAEFPAVPEYRKGLAQSHINLAILLSGLGKLPEAEEHRGKALAIWEKLAAENPSVPEYRGALARGHNTQGGRLASSGNRPGADEHFRKALAMLEKLSAEFPGEPQFRVELGGSYCNFGIRVRNSGQTGESLEWFEKAIRTLTDVFERDRRLVQAGRFLRNSHENRAMAYDRLRKFTEAIKDWDMAIELSPIAEQPRRRTARATSRLQAGQVTEAVAEVDELAKSASGDAVQSYDFACSYAIASGKSADKKQEYADRAMEVLQKAVNAGWNNVAHMAKDTELDPIRGREDFKKLIEGLAKKSSAKPEQK